MNIHRHINHPGSCISRSNLQLFWVHTFGNRFHQGRHSNAAHHRCNDGPHQLKMTGIHLARVQSHRALFLIPHRREAQRAPHERGDHEKGPPRFPEFGESSRRNHRNTQKPMHTHQCIHLTVVGGGPPILQRSRRLLNDRDGFGCGTPSKCQCNFKAFLNCWRFPRVCIHLARLPSFRSASRKPNVHSHFELVVQYGPVCNFQRCHTVGFKPIELPSPSCLHGHKCKWCCKLEVTLQVVVDWCE